ncbi:poly-gamma-glutamate hydrolase family protein [Crossiella sp. CA-258035]|uniref:poly-gamma-glutamate hydrolase family protein n=1 Tax=Crossiella sp. CA-258035 TaxID=2981138 RepID=UPI0024BCDC9B|nr:poly-gamma-glutamate hydrolase family protein [Crossiella sp. CA-258035]WHT18388.1 poly-gamma-glutamate hydrolase family protein [Crossiella sp. CA-258035]
MSTASRRAFLGLVAATAIPAAAARPASAADKYPSNTALYADPGLVEGIDYARRYRRHEQFDDSLTQKFPFPGTTILAPHGGGIEAGTSELCHAVAGYHPGTLQPAPEAGPRHDLWMFEGIRPTHNAELHVTSAHCDDPVALSLCAGARRALGLHGCSPAQLGLPEGAWAVLVGGRDEPFRRALLTRLGAAGFQVVDGAVHPTLSGQEPANIANRTLRGAGGQLELTTGLRDAMFTINTRPERRNTTTLVFWNFVAAVRVAIADVVDL